MIAGEFAPERGIVKAEWKPIVQQSAPSTLSGASDVLELGPSYWEVDIDVDCPKREDFDTWSIFLAGRDGADWTFTMPRAFRKFPRDRSVQSDAGLSLNGVNAAARTITLAGAGTGKISPGDMLSYRTAASGYWIGTAKAAATPVGGVVTVPVWPAPMTPHASAREPRRLYALGEFRLIGEPRWREGARNRSVSFKARQVIR